MTKYIGVSGDGTYIERNDLDILRQVPTIEHILKVNHDIDGHGYLCNMSTTLINGDGSLKTMLVGNFELLDIGTVLYDRQSNDQWADLMFLDKRISKNFKVSVRAGAPKLIQEQILPLMAKLNDLGSYAAYELSLTNDALKKENEILKKRLEDLETK